MIPLAQTSQSMNLMTNPTQATETKTTSYDVQRLDTGVANAQWTTISNHQTRVAAEAEKPADIGAYQYRVFTPGALTGSQYQPLVPTSASYEDDDVQRSVISDDGTVKHVSYKSGR
jgi:hypothetical protein